MNRAVVCFSAIFSSLMVISGCGGSGQDEGASETSTQFRGAAIDGYVARARVYIDTDRDNVIDSFEARNIAFTDDDGYFSYNPITDTDYCASDATEAQRVYCLESSASAQNAIIRLVGGYDLSTGLPFTGTLSYRLDTVTAGETVSALLTPISSIFAEISDTTERTRLLTSLGIEEDDLSTDFITPTDANGNVLTDGGGNPVVDGRLLNLAQKIHKVVQALTENIESTYTEVGDDEGLPNDASAIIYSALASRLSAESNSFTLDTLIEDGTQVREVIDEVDNSLRTLYQAEELTLPSELVSGSDASAVSDLISQVADIPDVVDQLVNLDPNATVTLEEATGSLRAIEVLTDKIANGRDSSEISRLRDLLENDTGGLRDDLLTALSQDNADVSGLASDAINFTDANDINNAALLPAGAVAFSNLPGSQLKVSDPDLDNNTKDVEVIFYFEGETNATSGLLHACAKYIEDVENGQINEASTTGRYAVGDWSLLGTAADSSVGYSILARFEDDEEGLSFQTILKSADTDQGVFLYEFDLGDDGLEVFESLAGVETRTQDIPTTDNECKSLLPSRIGL